MVSGRDLVTDTKNTHMYMCIYILIILLIIIIIIVITLDIFKGAVMFEG